jgi:hypothetical protein
MAISGKSPNRELTDHIALGGDHPSGAGIVRDIDADFYATSYANPQVYGGTAQLFEGDSDGTRNAVNLAQATGLDSGQMYGEPYNNDDFTKNDDHGPDSGGANVSKYGPMNDGKD